MPQVQSLDDLIAKKATEYADQIKAAAAMADKEEEIRIESEKQLAFIQKETGIKLEGKHEFTVASGRIDSVYSRVIIEYKNPKSPGDRIGPKADSPGSKKVVEQIKKRFYDMRHEHGQPLNSLFGVGLDGNYFIFVRFRDEKWQVQEPVEVNSHSAERFLWALFNLGTKGKAFSPEYLAGDFGSEGGNTVAISGIHALYDAIVTTDNPKAQTFFSQWKILFGEVCGYDVDSQSEKLRKLAEFYQVGVKDPKPAELLFAVHTYYALFMKLLAAEIVAFFHKLPTPLQKMMQATTSNKLKREMEDLKPAAFSAISTSLTFSKVTSSPGTPAFGPSRLRSLFVKWSHVLMTTTLVPSPKTLPAAVTCSRNFTSNSFPRASATTSVSITRPTGSPNTSSTSSATSATPTNACSIPPAVRAPSSSWPLTTSENGTTRIVNAAV